MLTGKNISKKENDRVLKVWDKFEMKTMKDYHDLYLKCDAFENIRNNSIKNYGLCPSHYLSARALSWYPMRIMTKVKLEFISDPAMYIFFDKGIRGGVYYISNIYSKANNKYLKSYDPKQKLNILYT